MKPLNEKERNENIWRFVGLFVLAILPIVFAVYEFARVDEVELVKLRRTAAEYVGKEQDTEGLKLMRKEIASDIQAINIEVKNAVNNYSMNGETNIQREIAALKENLEELMIKASDNPAQLEYAKLVTELTLPIEDLNEDLYSHFWIKFKNEKEFAEATQKELVRCQGDI